MSTSARACSLLAAVALASACGGGSSSGLASTKTPTTADAEKAAAAILLKTGDLPSGYAASAHDNSDDSDDDNKAFASCLGASEPNKDTIKDSYSDDFTKGEAPLSTQVSSEVDVVKDAKQASSDAKAYASSKAKPCLETFVSKLLADGIGDASGVTLGNPKVETVDVNKEGVDSGFGYTVTTVATAQGQSIPFEVIFIGLLKDHTKVSLTAVSVGSTLSGADRDGLVTKLRERTAKSAV